MCKNDFKFSYIRELDGLRGISIILVLMGHAGIPFFQGGIIGVDIFFVLSGFLITSLLIKEFNESNDVNLKYFYLRRLLRLAPALIVLLLVLLLGCILLLDHTKTISYCIDAVITVFYMTNWARAFDIHPPSLLGHTWSLSIEEQFYILWPITIIALLKKVKNRKLLAIIICSAALFSWSLRIYMASKGVMYDRLYNGLDTRADSLLTGCTLSILLSFNLISNNTMRFFKTYYSYISIVSIAALVLIIISLSGNNLLMYYYGFAITEISVAILILYIFTNHKSQLNSILSLSSLVWIGKLSYGIYLWHYPIFLFLNYLNLSKLFVIICGTLLTFISASFSFYLIELPFLKFKRRIESTPIRNTICARELSG